MAIVNSNPIVEGFSGMLGNAIVFRNLRGKTIVSTRPAPPKKQSEQQRINRSKFKEAAFWAQNILLDPAKKEYYQKKARKLKLPNAYTAAIADYMRTPQVKEFDRKEDTAIYRVDKKDFELKKVEVELCDAGGEIIETRTLVKDSINEWMFSLQGSERHYVIHVNVTAEAGELTTLKIEPR